jgi:hypothetical protein
MPIKVLVDSIEIEDIYKIIEIYNQNKDTNDEPLERLDRCEGGFQIKITDKKNEICDENQKIKQLRWKYKYLISFINCICFDEKEEKLLFESMKKVLGENVTFDK